jgi:hypothetical protein
LSNERRCFVMSRIMMAISLIVLTATGLGWAECQYIFPLAEQSGDDWVTAKWCTSEEARTNLMNGLSIFVDESGEIKTLWTLLFLEQGADFCNPYGLLTRLLNTEQMLYEVVYHRDNITIPKSSSEMDYAGFVVNRSEAGYEPVCTAEYEAQNPYPFGTTKLSQPHFTRMVPYRAATLVHEATHDDVDHISQDSVCISYVNLNDFSCIGKMGGGAFGTPFSDAYCAYLFNDCMAMTAPYWPRYVDPQTGAVYDCGSSVDIGFGMWNAQTNGVSFMLNSMDTFLKDPETNELYIQRYPGHGCGYVPLISWFAYDELSRVLKFKSWFCFLINPDYPERSKFWLDFFSKHFYADYSGLNSNYIVAPAWQPTFPCDKPCVPGAYLSGGALSCNEDYQPGNASINHFNFNLCRSITNDLPAQFTLTDIAKAADQFEQNKKDCISGVSTDYLCDVVIQTSDTLLELETNFKVEDMPGYFVPDTAVSDCERKYCQWRFDSSWAQTARESCYHWDDPLGCSKHLCGELGNDPTNFENFKMLLCRKGYFDNNGDPKAYATKDAGKCDQDYMDCVAQEAFQIWLASEECTLRDQPGDPYQFITHLPQLHALNLAASGLSYAGYQEACPNCQLHSCEAMQASCTSLMKDMASKLGEFLTHTAIPKQIVLKEQGMPTGPSIDPVIKPIERSLKTMVDIVARPYTDLLGYGNIVDQFLTVPEYQHASARALGHEAFFSIVGTRGFQKVFAKETLALYENATLRFDFNLNPEQSALLPALTEISTTRQRIEAPATLSLFESLATSSPETMFNFVQDVSHARTIGEINMLLDRVSAIDR